SRSRTWFRCSGARRAAPRAAASLRARRTPGRLRSSPASCQPPCGHPAYCFRTASASPAAREPPERVRLRAMPVSKKRKKPERKRRDRAQAAPGAAAPQKSAAAEPSSGGGLLSKMRGGFQAATGGGKKESLLSKIVTWLLVAAAAYF